jgi:hypothetical protein
LCAEALVRAADGASDRVQGDGDRFQVGAAINKKLRTTTLLALLSGGANLFSKVSFAVQESDTYRKLEHWIGLERQRKCVDLGKNGARYD